MAQRSAVRRRQNAVSAIAVIACLGFSTNSSADLVPHQAIYSMKLADVRSTSTFNGLEGAAVAQIDRTCEGWIVTEQIVMTMSTVAGGAISREMNFKGKETLDGQSYTFDSKISTNGRPENYSGTARYKNDGTVEAEFVTPSPREVPLPDGTVFYMGMNKWLLDLAASGKKTGEIVAFDGTDDEGPRKVTVFVLPDKSDPGKLNGDPKLLAGTAWKIRMAFFPLGVQAAEPEFEIALRMLENGVVTSFELIFEDMTVDQVLEDVLPSKDERCS